MGFSSLISSRLNLNLRFLWDTAEGLPSVTWMRVLAGDQGAHVALHHVDENKITGVASFDPILTLRMRRINVSSDTLP
jgi:hypothetical protein